MSRDKAEKQSSYSILHSYLIFDNRVEM